MTKRILVVLTCLCIVASGATRIALQPRPVQAASNPSDVTLTDHPVDMQVYQRNPNTNTATVRIAGTVDDGAYDAIIVRVTRNGALWNTKQQALNNGSGDPSFAITFDIPAELANYDFETLARDGGGEDPIATADDVVAGDIFLIHGQSNANARRRDDTSINGALGSQFIRSFGRRDISPTMTQNDIEWHQAEGEKNYGEGSIGQWGLKLGRMIVDTYGIPVAILNQAETSTKISEHQRNDSDPDDLATLYGRLLWRTQQAEWPPQESTGQVGIADNVRAMFWYQGEADRSTSASDYEQMFTSLYNDWKTDYPNIEKVYVFQIRNTTLTCPPAPSLALRDRQRQFGDIFIDVDVMSTTAIDPQIDGCHFPYTDGYETIAENIFRLVARDFYGSGVTQNIEAPNVDYAYFSNEAKTQVTVVMRNRNDTITFDGYGGPSAGPHLDFRLEGPTLITATDGGVVGGNKIVLTFPQSGENATGISYVDHSGVNPPDPDPRWGQWVTNSNGVGLLAFYNIPFGEANLPPLVAITTPAANAKINRGDVPIQAPVSDDGAVTQVEFFVNGASIGLGTETAPNVWSITWAATPGSYALTAVARDNDGATTTSAPVPVIVNTPPSVAIVAPTAGATFVQGNTVPIVADATDSDGAVARVEFYADSGSGSVWLHTDNDEAPWSFDAWMPASAGGHTLVVRAYDNDNDYADSAPVSITVTQVETPTPTPTSTETPTPTPTATVGTPQPGTPTPTATVGTPQPGTPTPTATVGTPQPGTPTPTATDVSSAVLFISGETTGAPGSSFLLVGTGFTPNVPVQLTINGHKWAVVTADISGMFAVAIDTLPSAPPGVYSVGVAGNNQLAATFTLDPNAPPVAVTGQQLRLTVSLTYLPVMQRQ